MNTSGSNEGLPVDRLNAGSFDFGDGISTELERRESVSSTRFDAFSTELPFVDTEER